MDWECDIPQEVSVTKVRGELTFSLSDVSILGSSVSNDDRYYEPSNSSSIK